MIKLNIVIFHKLPTPYNDMFFRLLGERSEVNFEVYHLWRKKNSRPWSVSLGEGYNNYYLNTRLLGIDWKFLFKSILDRNSFYIIGDWAHLSSISVILSRILMNNPVAIWADTPIENIHRPWPKRRLRLLLIKWLLQRVDIVFGTGNPGMRVLENLGAPKKSIRNLPCFVDLIKPKNYLSCLNSKEIRLKFRKEHGCAPQDIIFLMSGMCTHKKGHDIGINAFFECLKNCNKSIKMIIAGTGPENKNLEKLVCDYKIENHVKFLGWLNPTDMDLAYHSCDVLLHCARWDPFPLVILEGMSWGKAVIGSKVCGSVEDRIVHGVNGMIFDHENAQELVSVMRTLIDNQSLITKLGFAARKTAENWPVDYGINLILKTSKELLVYKENRV